MTELKISKLKLPIGLDLGGRTPEETAISIAAEIVTVQFGGATNLYPTRLVQSTKRHS